jgi:hypothetical protein
MIEENITQELKDSQTQASLLLWRERCDMKMKLEALTEIYQQIDEVFENFDLYFDSIRDFASDVRCEVEDLQLMICEPNYAREVEYNEMYDELPEDMGLHDVATELAAMFDEINKYIAEHKPIISWGEGKCRARLINS